MQNYTRTGLKIVGNRSYKVINPYTFISMYGGAQESYNSECLQSSAKHGGGAVMFGAAFQPVVSISSTLPMQ